MTLWARIVILVAIVVVSATLEFPVGAAIRTMAAVPHFFTLVRFGEKRRNYAKPTHKRD